MVRIHDPRVKNIHSKPAKKQTRKKQDGTPNYYEFYELCGTGDEVNLGPASGYVGSW